MRQQSPIQTPSFGRTFVFAAVLLGVVAVFELGGVTVAFFKRMGNPAQENSDDGSGPPPLKIDVKRLMADSPPPVEPGLGADPLASGGDERFAGPRPVPVNPDLFLAPPAVMAANPPVVAELPVVTGVGTPRPTPVPLSAFTPKVDPRFNEWVEQGKLLRNSGDTAGALVKFRAASALDPGNPLAIAEQAFTFEKMSLPDKAAEQWRLIIAMGDRAGVYFSAAKSKLDTAVRATVRETTGGTAEIPSGKLMGLGKPSVTEDPDPAFAKKLTLSVPIRSRMTETVAVREMKVFVLFYERVNGKDIARTNANVSNRWSSPPADWLDGDTETLEVSYELPQPPARGERREYYGYIVRLYYRGELQDTQAEPASLNQKYPPPYTLAE